MAEVLATVVGSAEELATTTFKSLNAGGLTTGGLATGGTIIGRGVDTGGSAT